MYTYVPTTTLDTHTQATPKTHPEVMHTCGQKGAESAAMQQCFIMTRCTWSDSVLLHVPGVKRGTRVTRFKIHVSTSDATA